MAHTELVAFVEAALKAGESRDAARRALEQAGWSSEQIADALAHYADVPFAVPVPRPRATVSARDAFWYLLMFGALYVSAFHFGDLLFAIINRAFPDDLRFPGQVEFIEREMRFATAALIVAFPLFLFAAWKIGKEIAAEPARRNSAIRRWLTYITLLVAAAFVVGDAIALVYNVLNGELTTRFILKVLVVAAIAGTVFGYYTWSNRADDAALGR